MEVRLNKYISDSGFCSRREADRHIESGNVRVNGRAVGVGAKVSSGDVVKVNGTLIEGNDNIVYIALNKPVGVVSTTDPTERNNIVDFVNYPTRIFNIGRLDKPSEGLILLTNDGGIVNKILRAANNHEKEYEVAVDKPITDEFIKRMRGGLPILGTITKKCKVTQEGVNHFRITLTQGLNRQIRRMCEYLGYEVTKLKRVRIMNITLDKLPSGQWRELTESEVEELNHLLRNSDNTPAAAAKKEKAAPKAEQPKERKKVVKNTPAADEEYAAMLRSSGYQGNHSNNSRGSSSASGGANNKHKANRSNNSKSRKAAKISRR
ncbi:MAG: 23S rRNA pseudouridine(2604) synthase RluF [Rikenellaceae bacterium]